jgi:hypothetical protein
MIHRLLLPDASISCDRCSDHGEAEQGRLGRPFCTTPLADWCPAEPDPGRLRAPDLQFEAAGQFQDEVDDQGIDQSADK